MSFKVGDRVRLINSEGLAAPVGSTAIVTRYEHENRYMQISWIDNGGTQQQDGGYKPQSFEIVLFPPLSESEILESIFF